MQIYIEDEYKAAIINLKQIYNVAQNTICIIEEMSKAIESRQAYIIGNFYMFY